ncbi:venom serine carboxypeptidase-like protein [Leptotrombidium deliense]|uniref:Venom serine carboxypeptidase-like protein n=1 Tax=Leptotrombidium deliense TaxID=299467 RepID=A0A443S151_9ACAR|nr:venom serine carboxypeptidase-like protein [Leptotrombidium deliense]
MYCFKIVALFLLIKVCENCDTCGEPLYLTSLIESGQIQQAKKLSRVWAKHFGCETESYSGYLTVNKNYNSNLFFWFFKSKNLNAPILLWLQGGPGATSLMGLFMLNGPFKITKKLRIKCRTYSWTKRFSMLYIDQPVGTGFSFTDNENGYSKNLNESTDDLLNALTQFFKMFTELRGNEFYATGEAYGGKFASALAYKIHNDEKSTINLKGIAVGNAFIDPISYLELSGLLYQLSLIDEQQRVLFEENETEIKELIKEEQYSTAFDKYDQLFLRSFYTGKTLYNNFTGYENFQNFLHQRNQVNLTILGELFKDTKIRRNLHVGNLSFHVSNHPVLMALKEDFFRSAKEILIGVMDNYRVMLYSGNLDIIVAPVFNNRMLNNLKWKHSDAYLKAERKIWRTGKTEIIGYIKNVYDFYEVIIRNSGHLVPLEKPKFAFEMITKFINNQM